MYILLFYGVHTLNWVFCQGGRYQAFSGGVVGGRWLFFFFDEVKMKHFVFFRGVLQRLLKILFESDCDLHKTLFNNSEFSYSNVIV